MVTATDVIACIVAYLLGGIPTAYLVVRRLHGGDIRSMGSGNVGATNAGRILGWRGFALVFALDAAKGALPVAVALLAGPALKLSLAPAWLGAAAVAGHCWTPWLRFNGGKGVATATGAIALFCPPAAALGFAVWTLVALTLKLSSLGSLLGLVMAGTVVLGYGDSAEFAAFLAIAVIVIWRHRGNIRRLILGTERRMGTTA